MPGYNNQKRIEAFEDFHQKAEALHAKFKRKCYFSEEDFRISGNTRLSIGDEYYALPVIPSDPKLAFALFIDYYATFNFYKEQNIFIDHYFSIKNESAIKSDIEHIENFIASANKISYTEACIIRHLTTKEIEYKRFVGGFYNDYLMDSDQHSLNNVAACVYGRYFLFYEYLKNKLAELHSADLNIKTSKLRDISFTYELDYFTNEKNIPNQELVNETIAYFKKGAGARAFEPLEFLNLLEKQFRFVIKNISNEAQVMTELKTLPLTKLERHVLYGLILKWFGGYPIIPRSDIDDNYRLTKKAIEREFLSYPENTPEKEFCKANRKNRSKMEMMEDALNDWIKYGVPVDKSLESMGYYSLEKKEYRNFDELFNDLYKDGLIKEIENQEQYYFSQTKYRYDFKLWLENNKGWIDRDEDQFLTLLNKETLIEFLEFQSSKKPLTDIDVSRVLHNEIIGFKNIFVKDEWEKYIKALEQTRPALLDSQWLFIGNKKNHKGVICSWVKHLQNEGIIKQSISRSKLAAVLNAELKDFDMGKDGKTFDNVSTEYKKFEKQLIDITK